MRIRQFQWSDYDAVVAVWATAGREVVPRAELEAKLTRDPELFLVAETPDIPETPDVTQAPDVTQTPDVTQAPDSAEPRGATETRDKVAGVVMGTYDGRRGWILRLAVHPAHRRAGIATQLVAELEHRFRRLGCTRVNLLVMPDNTAGLRFWQALGYLPYPDVLCSKPLDG